MRANSLRSSSTSVSLMTLLICTRAVRYLMPCRWYMVRSCRFENRCRSCVASRRSHLCYRVMNFYSSKAAGEIMAASCSSVCLRNLRPQLLLWESKDLLYRNMRTIVATVDCLQPSSLEIAQSPFRILLVSVMLPNFKAITSILKPGLTVFALLHAVSGFLRGFLAMGARRRRNSLILLYVALIVGFARVRGSKRTIVVFFNFLIYNRTTSK